MISDKTLYRIALTQIKGVGIVLARALMQVVGDEEAIFKELTRNLEKIPRISRRLIQEIRHPEVMKRAETEMNFVVKNNIAPLFFTDPDYPQRLCNCIDAPVLLYTKGNARFNGERVVSIVGTRDVTEYGQDFCRNFVKELSLQYPDVLIVSGLAYGIDICAHRAALKNGVPTVGVLAHGLDRMYPSVHRKTAVEMLQNGGLLTEFPSGTNPDKHNFVKRNRIVAGLADAVIVVESGSKGGSLITADIANSYFREVFALPGRVSDIKSAGCNELIANNKAVLLNGVEGFIAQMGWSQSTKKQEPKQRELFLNLSEEEEKIFQILNGNDAMQVNRLAIELDTPVAELFMTLLELEMKNVVQALPGGMYKLL